jgi:hypothetical protein
MAANLRLRVVVPTAELRRGHECDFEGFRKKVDADEGVYAAKCI